MRKMSWRGKEVSSKRIRKLWRNISKGEPMPNIKAYNLPRDEFFRLLHEGNKICGREGELLEYGKLTDERTTTAFVQKVWLTSGEVVYLIFRREDSEHSEKQDLIHELKHIYNKEPEKLKKVLC